MSRPRHETSLYLRANSTGAPRGSGANNDQSAAGVGVHELDSLGYFAAAREGLACAAGLEVDDALGQRAEYALPERLTVAQLMRPYLTSLGRS